MNDALLLPGTFTKQEGSGRRIRFVASNGDVDRDGDIVKQNFDFKAYRKNPVGLWMHDMWSPPIFRVPMIKTEGAGDQKRTVAVNEFVPREIYPFAGIIEDMYLEGYLKAFSIRVTPIKVAQLNPEEKQELGIGPFGVLIEKSEFLEVSGVTIPSNREALIEGVEKGFWTEGAAKELRDLSRSDIRNKAKVDQIAEWLQASRTDEPDRVMPEDAPEWVRSVIEVSAAQVKALEALGTRVRALEDGSDDTGGDEPTGETTGEAEGNEPTESSDQEGGASDEGSGEDEDAIRREIEAVCSLFGEETEGEASE